MEYSRITDSVLIGTTPGQRDFERLHTMGVRLVINMRFLWGRPPADGAPAIEYLSLRSFDSPLVPIPMNTLVRGTRAALAVIRKHGSVYVHCSRGRHRSVAMAAAILIAQGSTSGAAMQLIKERHAAADPDASHIRARIVEFERIWRAQVGSALPDAA